MSTTVIFKNPLYLILILIGLGLGVVSAIFGLWDYIEPIMGVGTFVFAVIVYLQTKKAKKRVYQDNGDHDWVVAVQVGRSVVQAVNKQFNHIDCLIDVIDVLGTNTLVTDNHYNKMAKTVFKAIEEGQGKNIKLIVSGPLGLSVMIGQLIGIHHYNITVFQFDMTTGEYIAMPKVSRDLLY
jgi:hypothetical protein